MSDGRDFDDELRRAMRAEADKAQQDPASWSRIEERRAGRRSAGAWRWGALAIAAAAAVALVAVLAWPRDDGDEVIVGYNRWEGAYRVGAVCVWLSDALHP